MKTLIICFIVSIQYCTTNSNLSSVEYAVNNSETLTGVIIKDINNAFNIVTNNTVLLKKLMPEMFDLSVPKTDMVFKLPKLDGSGGTMALMHRTDFMAPKFPNLTTKYMDLMKERRHILKPVSHKLSDSTVKIQANVYHSTAEGQNDWTELGLEGWTGEVSQPLQYFQPEEMQGPDQINAVLRDYNLQQIIRHHIGNYDEKNKNKSIDFCVDGIGQKVTVLNENDDQDGNVYIARVNDPFGFSTKWEFENYTNLEHINLSDDRLKRGVITLYSMIKCSTGCEPLFYKGYGCYCGFLGAGVPVDGIDRCCKLHDKCYEKSNCISYLEYFVPYIWKCYGGKPLCAFDHGEFGGPQSCAARLCYCDMRLSRCLRKFGCPRRRAVCRTSTARQLQNLLLF